MNRFFTLPEDATPKAKSAFRYATIIMLGAIAAFINQIYVVLRTGAWQLWCSLALVVLVFIASQFSHYLVRKGNVEAAARVLIYSLLVGIIAMPFLIANIGIGLALSGIMFTVVIASRTVERPERLVFISFVVAIATIIADLLLPPYRLVVPAIQFAAPIITGGLVLILGFLTIRGFADYSLRTKMIFVIVTIVMISIATIAILTNRSLTANLTESVGNNLSALANSKANEIAQAINRDADLLHALALDKTVQELARSANTKEPLSQTEITRLDSQWRVADANDNNSDLLVMSTLTNSTASQLRQFQVDFPQNVEIFLTDSQGILLAATNRTSDYYQADEEWWQVAIRDGTYIGQPEYDESSKTRAITMAIVVRGYGSENKIGVLRTTVKLDTLLSTLAAGSFGKTGRTELYLPNKQELTIETGKEGALSIIVEASGFDYNALAQAQGNYFEIPHHQVPVLASQALVASPDLTGKASLASTLNWRVVVFQNLEEARQPVETQTFSIVMLSFIIFIAATLAALGLAQIISGPIIRLNAVAEKVASGDLSVQAKVERGDETGALAKTFNSMTAQLRDLVGTLEQRVADRTKALATSAEVSRHLSTILNERQLIIEVVERLQAAFDYYHVHIYLLDSASGDLVIAGGTGDAGAALLGSGHRIPQGKGLVGRAAHNNVPVLVSDTTKDPAWLPNPLLPETKSEAAVPIASADRVLGVLDVQQNEVDALKQDDVDLLQSLANQIAIALLNARSYVEIQQRAEREARITSIGLKIKSTTSIEAALQTTARELGRTLGANDIRVILDVPSLAKNSQKDDQATA